MVEKIHHKWKSIISRIYNKDTFFKSSYSRFNNTTYTINTMETIDTFIELIDFLTEHIPEIEQWCTEYSKGTHPDFSKEWFLCGIEQGVGYITHRIYSKYASLPKEYHTIWSSFSPHISEAESLIARYESRLDIKHCTDQSILEKHKDKPCDSNGWFCWTCDDMELTWKYALEKELKQSNNIFLNPAIRESYIQQKKQHHPTIDLQHIEIQPSTEEIDIEKHIKSGKTTMEVMKAILDDLEYTSVALHRLKYTPDTQNMNMFFYFKKYIPSLKHFTGLKETLEGLKAR